MMPGAPPVPLAASSTAAVQPLPDSTLSLAARVAGVAGAPLAGTDIPPTEPAEPLPASVAPPPPGVEPAHVVPKPNPAPNGVASPIVTPKGAPATKWFRVPSADAIIMMHQDSVTSAELKPLENNGIPAVPWIAPQRAVSSSPMLADGVAAALDALCRLLSSPLVPELAALLLTALATAADCAPDPAGFVDWAGSCNGVTCAVVAALAA